MKERIEKAEQNLKNLLPDFQGKMSNHQDFEKIMKSLIFTDLYQLKNLKSENRELAILAVNVGIKNLEEVGIHLQIALNLKIDPLKLREVIYQTTPYTGIGNAMAALKIFDEVILKNQIHLPKSSNLTPSEKRLETGASILKKLTDQKIEKSWNEQDEVEVLLNQFLKENCFGDFYARPYLNYQERELVICCAIMSLGNFFNQLSWHLSTAVKVGWKKDEIVLWLVTGIPYLGYPKVVNAIGLLKQVK